MAKCTAAESGCRAHSAPGRFAAFLCPVWTERYVAPTVLTPFARRHPHSPVRTVQTNLRCSSLDLDAPKTCSTLQVVQVLFNTPVEVCVTETLVLTSKTQNLRVGVLLYLIQRQGCRLFFFYSETKMYLKFVFDHRSSCNSVILVFFQRIITATTTQWRTAGRSTTQQKTSGLFAWPKTLRTSRNGWTPSWGSGSSVRVSSFFPQNVSVLIRKTI